MKRRTLGCLILPLTGILATTSRSDEVTETVPALEISLAKNQHVVGEPLILRLALANRSSHGMPRYFFDDEDFADTEIILTFSQVGKPRTLETRLAGSGAQRPPLVLRSPPTIDPGAFWQCERMFVPLYLLDHVYTLLPAGSYWLSAKVFVPGRKPIGISDSSNTVNVTIEEPTGDDAKAFALLGPKGKAAFFSGVAGGYPDEIRELLTKYPKSTYARYAQARLILDAARRRWSMGSPSSAADLEKVRSLVAEGRTHIQQFPDMPLNDNILLWCARLQHMARDEEASARTLQQLFTDYPQSEVLQTARKHVEDWRRSHKAFESIQVPPPQTQPPIRSRGDDSVPRSRPAGASTPIELTTKIRSTQPAAQPTTEPSDAPTK